MNTSSRRVALTGATGFVGRYVLDQLIQRGCHVQALVRNTPKITQKSDFLTWVYADLFDNTAIRRCLERTDSIIHLVGIITENRRLSQTFERIHHEITTNLVQVAVESGCIDRFIHMSALGSRPDAASCYHRTKWLAEQAVRDCGLNWTIFRPSIIHGPDGQFMRMLCEFWTRRWPPIVPYFGGGVFGQQGGGKLQPVWVTDVAHCCVDALFNENTIGKTYEFGGPQIMSWQQMYRLCKQYITGARNKPIAPIPVWLAKVLARVPGVPFNIDQVIMSREDSVCDIQPLQHDFQIQLKSFESALAKYAPELMNPNVQP